MRKRPSKRRIKARLRLGKWIGIQWMFEYRIQTNMVLEYDNLRQAYRIKPYPLVS